MNYNAVTASIPITVTPAPLLVTAGATNRVYGAANPAFTATFTGFVNGDDESDLDAPVTFSTVADATSPVGSYDIVPAGAADLNYAVSFATAPLSVTPARLLVTANATNRVYGDTNPVFTATFTGFLNGDDETDLLGTLAFATPAGLLRLRPDPVHKGPLHSGADSDSPQERHRPESPKELERRL